MGEGGGEGIDEVGVEKWFVALDIDDVGGGYAMGGGFGNAVGSGGVIVAGDYGAGSDVFAEGENALIVCGDDEFVEFGAS